jgi:hypothetical protein
LRYIELRKLKFALHQIPARQLKFASHQIEFELSGDQLARRRLIEV